MTIQAQNSWVWTQDKKQWIKTWNRDVGIKYKQITEQVEHFKEALPDLADEAAQSAQPFLTAAGDLLNFAHGAGRRKYQPMSPNEVQEKITAMLHFLAAWRAFTSRSDVRAAIQAANQRIAAHNHRLQQHQREQRSSIEGFLASAEFSAMVDGLVAHVLDAAETLTKLAMGMDKFGDETDRPRLQRLFLVHFIRTTYQFDQKRMDTLKPFVINRPPPTFVNLLKHTIYLFAKDYLLNPAPLTNLSLPEMLGARTAIIFESLLKSIQQWQNEGVTSRAISPGYYTIMGVDYSLEAQPE